MRAGWELRAAVVEAFRRGFVAAPDPTVVGVLRVEGAGGRVLAFNPSAPEPEIVRQILLELSRA